MNKQIMRHTDKTPRGWGYCVFGEVVEGMDIMDKISRVRTTAHGPFAADAPMIPVSIRSIVVVASDHKN